MIPSKTADYLKSGLTALTVLIITCLGISYYEYQQRPLLGQKSLTIGTLGNPSHLQGLVKYLQSKLRPSNFIDFLLNKPIEIKTSARNYISYERAKNHIIRKEWDIAFTLSPMLSITAKENEYSFAALMFANRPPYYQSGIYVRADSPIRSLEDITPNHSIALGGFNSASSFYMPIYNLFGKTLRIYLGHDSQKIKRMVKEGKVDLGAGVIGDTVNPHDSELRIIHQSRNIPSAGVYLSPKISPASRRTLQNLLLNAPNQVKKSSNYGIGREPDYSSFIQVIRRTDEVISCSDFRRNPVTVFCHPVAVIEHSNKEAARQLPVITGVINGWRKSGADKIWFTLSSKDRIYQVEILQSSVPSPLQWNNRQVQVYAEPQLLNNGFILLRVTDPNHIQLLD